MTLTNAPPGSGLFVLLAVFLTVATIWLLLRAIETRPKEIDARSFLVLIIVSRLLSAPDGMHAGDKGQVMTH
jgi:hypothetical protein